MPAAMATKTNQIKPEGSRSIVDEIVIRTSMHDDWPRKGVWREYEDGVPSIRKRLRRGVSADPMGERETNVLELGAGDGRPRHRVDECVLRPGMASYVVWTSTGAKEICKDGSIMDLNIRDVGRIDSRVWGHG